MAEGTAVGPAKICLVGFGAVCENAHVPALLAQAPAVKVVSVVDVAANRLDRAEHLLGTATYSSLPAFLSSGLEVDLAIVTLPPQVAPTAVGSLAKAGIAVLVEKPFAISCRAAEHCVSRCPNPSTIRVVHNYIHRSDVSTATDLIRAGSIGAVRLLRLERPDSSHYKGAGQDPDWRRSIDAGGGCLADNGYHWLYLSELLTGSPVVAAVGLLGASAGSSVEDVGSATLRHKSGAVTTVLTGWCALSASEVLEVHGTEGSIEMLGERHGVILRSSGGMRRVMATDSRESFHRMYEDLGQVIRGGGLPGEPIESNLRVLRLLDHLYSANSSETGHEPQR